jgi:hypothetical protein
MQETRGTPLGRLVDAEAIDDLHYLAVKASGRVLMGSRDGLATSGHEVPRRSEMIMLVPCSRCGGHCLRNAVW